MKKSRFTETQIRLWDENGMIFNTASGSWFIPIDGMVIPPQVN